MRLTKKKINGIDGANYNCWSVDHDVGAMKWAST